MQPAPADLVQIAALLRQQQAQLDALVKRTPAGPVLTLAEAIAYAKHDSDSAFYRWCARWRVRSITNGRYARGHLDRALAREASTRRAARQAA